VDGLEHELEEQARVVRLSVLSRTGQDVARRYGVRGMPTLLVFDDKGNLIGREVGFPDRNKIKALITGY